MIGKRVQTAIESISFQRSHRSNSGTTVKMKYLLKKRNDRCLKNPFPKIMAMAMRRTEYDREAETVDTSLDASTDASEREQRRAYVANRMANERNRRMQIEGDRAARAEMYEKSNASQAVTLTSYAPMLIAGIFKDLLDLTGIGSLPGVGTVVTFCASILIFFLALLRGSFRGNMKYRKGMILIVGTAVEAFGFGLNFLPMETLTVIAMYSVDKAEAKGGMIGKIASGVKTNAIKRG